MNRNMSLKSALMGAALLIGLGTASAFAQQSSTLTSDAQLANQVQTTFAHEPKLNGAELAIRAKDGRVTLFGSASEEQAAEAYRDAISVPGVKSVSNYISMTEMGA
jgi:osmotically-inducible protein OsmY